MDPIDMLQADVVALFRPFRARLIATRDEAGLLSLDTPSRDGGNRPIFFGSATRKPAHVSIHLFPLYVRPDLKTGLSPDFRRRMQGKTCFTLRPRDGALLAEAGALIASGFDAFVELRYVEAPDPRR